MRVQMRVQNEKRIQASLLVSCHMERPAGVTVIAFAFFLVAGYLFTVGAIELVTPGTISPNMGAPFMYGRELAGPQSAFLVAAGWGLVGWGLLQTRNWARWCAVVLMVLGVAAGIPAVSAAATDLNWRLAWYGGLMMAKIVAVWFLTQAADVVEAFKANKS
jgi:hypothetical protein